MDLLILTPPDFIYRKPDEVTPTYSEERNIPYGALILASFLREHGMLAMVAPLREFYQEGGCYMYFDDGTPESKTVFAQKSSKILDSLLHRLHPKAIGLSVNFAIHQLAVEIIIDQIRALSPDLPLLVGGTMQAIPPSTGWCVKIRWISWYSAKANRLVCICCSPGSGVVLPLLRVDRALGQMSCALPMRLGKAIVATRMPSLSAHIEDGQSGLCYPAGARRP